MTRKKELLIIDFARNIGKLSPCIDHTEKFHLPYASMSQDRNGEYVRVADVLMFIESRLSDDA